MNISFPLPWAEVGKTLDIDASTGICDYTSTLCAREAERFGHTTQIVEILAMSPTLKGTITHRVVVADGAYILDVPQTDMLKHTEGKSWTHVCAIMSYHIAPEFAGLKIALQRAMISPEWMFKPQGTPIPEYLQDENAMMAERMLGMIDNPKSNGDKYPVWTGIYNDLPVRYDSNTEELHYIPKQELQWVMDTFEPRIIPITPMDLAKAYSVDGKDAKERIMKQLKGGDRQYVSN